MKFIFAVLVLFVLLSCSSNIDTINDDIEKPYIPPSSGYDETYIINPGTSFNQVQMEYVRHHFTPNETRDVMAYGNDGAETWRYVWVNVLNQEFEGSIGAGTNHHRDGNVFTVPISIKAPSGLSNDEYYPTEGSINAGDRNSPATNIISLVEIEKREYKIHYSCMVNHDVFVETGNNTSANVSRAFSEANTTFIKIDENLYMTEQILDISGEDEDEEKQNLRNYINILSNSDYHDWDKNKVWVFGCKNYLANHMFFKDATMAIERTDGELITAIFIFSERVYFGEELLNKKERTARLIHELGHARGMHLVPSHGYIRGLTSTHAEGHNGKDKGLCVMRVPGNPYDENYTNDLYKKTIEKPHFCFGHIQMLFNCIFLEGV